MGEGKAEDTSHKAHGPGQAVPATAAPGPRELRAHWDLSDRGEKSTWLPLLKLVQALNEACGHCFLQLPRC